MKNDNSSEEETNLRLLKDAREDVVMARRHLKLALKQYDDVNVGADTVSKEMVSLRNAVTKAIEVETYLAKRSDETRSGGEGACPLDLVSARQEIFDRLAKIAAAR